MRWFLIVLALTSSAIAKEVQVNEQEQAAIQSICDVASTNSNITRDMRAGITNFCVTWEKKIATDGKPAEPQADPPKK
jgi:hypothetical protein